MLGMLGMLGFKGYTCIALPSLLGRKVTIVGSDEYAFEKGLTLVHFLAEPELSVFT
jgi:hypothetical protein